MAEILPNTSNDIGNRGCINTTLAQFKGKPRQVLVNIEDAYRLVVMDGSTLGGKFKAASLDELNSVKNTANSALTKTLADGYYLAKTGKATTAGTADRANALTTARSIGITGAVTGAGVSFNGTANININTTAVDGTKVSTFTAATASTAGTVGAVPAPSAGAQAKFLRGDGTWQVPTNTDTKVVQTQSTTAGEYALLAKDNTGVTTTTSGSVFSDGVTVNPNTKTITAITFKGSLHGNATSATKATNATKASQDAAGNDIPTTYATKTEVTQGLAGKANSSHTHTSADVTDLSNVLKPYATTNTMNTELAKKANASHTHTVSQITDMPNVVLKVNNIAPASGGNVNLGLHAVATSGDYNDLRNKPSMPATPNAYITETWRDGSQWYRKWSDGLIEQGGVIYTRKTSADVTFHKPFSGSSYSISGHCDPFDMFSGHVSIVGRVLNRSSASCGLVMSVVRSDGGVVENSGYNWHVHWSAVGY